MSEINFDFKKMYPFKWFILENYPFLEDSMDTLNNYQLFCKLGEEINKNRDAINDIGANQEQVVEGYNILYHWFENLDVQEEINNKLDDLVEDGTLESLIGAYIQPRIDAQNVTINNLRNETENKLNEQDEEINSISNQTSTAIITIRNQVESAASGSPAGVYDTVDDLETADPNHSKIYVVNADGKWYYYDTTSSEWTPGGVYQSTVADYDTTLTQNNQVANSFSVGERLNKFYFRNNYFNSSNCENNKSYDASGELVSTDNVVTCEEIIPVKNGDTIYAAYQGSEHIQTGTISNVYMVDNLGNFLSRIVVGAGKYTFNADGFIKVTTSKTSDRTDLTKHILYLNCPNFSLLNYDFQNSSDNLAKENEKSLDNITKFYNYFDVSKSYFNINLNNTGLLWYTNNNYFISNIIECKSGDVFYSNYFGDSGSIYIAQAAKFDSNKHFIERVTVTNGIYTADFNGYLIFNCYRTIITIDPTQTFAISKNETLGKFYPYKRYLLDKNNADVKISKIDSNNYLITFGNFTMVLFKNVNESVNANNWNLKNIQKAGNILVPEGTDFIGPVKINDNTDFIGGVHGNETTNYITVAINGSSLDITAINDDIVGDSMTITMKSSVYDQVSETKAFDRFVVINILKNKIHVSNSYVASANLTLKSAPIGGLIACRNPIIKDIMFNNSYYSTPPTSSVSNASKDNTTATINTINGSITVNNIIGHELSNYEGKLSVFENENPIRCKIYFFAYKQGTYSISSGDIIKGEFEYIFA